jgi:hypothetical protein
MSFHASSAELNIPRSEKYLKTEAVEKIETQKYFFSQCRMSVNIPNDGLFMRVIRGETELSTGFDTTLFIRPLRSCPMFFLV